MNRKGEGVAPYVKKKNTLNKNSAENGNLIKNILGNNKKRKKMDTIVGVFPQTTWVGRRYKWGLSAADDQFFRKACNRDSRGFQLGLINYCYLSLITLSESGRKSKLVCYCGFNYYQQEELVEKIKVAGISWENKDVIFLSVITRKERTNKSQTASCTWVE